MTRNDFRWARQQCWLLFCSSICLQLQVHHLGKTDAAQILPRIVGGSQSDVARRPYYASLYETSIQASDFRCGGSLVAPDVILSAAHCVSGEFQINYVVVNNTNIDGDNPHGYPRKVIKTMVHPSWNPSTLRNDLALLLLDEAVDGVEPVSYSRQFPVLSIIDNLTIIGLGVTQDGGSSPDSLQEVNVELTSFNFCDDAYSNDGLFDFLTGLSDSTQFCASSPGQDACQGDSGGPMVVSSPTVEDLQIGLISFGLGCARSDFPGVYTKLSAFSDWLDETLCSITLSSRPPFCLSKDAPPGVAGVVSRNVRISPTGLVVSTCSRRGLETIADSQNAVAYTLPLGVNSFDDVSIEDDFIFALDIQGRTICTYQILDDNEIVSSSCYTTDRWRAGAFGGISCRQGVCAIAQGDHGMAILDYNTSSGKIQGLPRVVNHLFDNVNAFYDVEVINASLAAMSTHFRNGLHFFRPRYGSMLVDLNTFENRNDNFRISENALRTSHAVEPSNFALVNAMHSKLSDGNTFLYTAHGAMTVQNVDESESTTVIEDPYLGGKFRAVTVAIDSGLAAFGGHVTEDNRNYIMMFDLEQDPMSPTPIGLFQIPNQILSVAIRDNLVAIVGTQDGVHFLNVSDLVESTSSGGTNVSAVTGSTIPPGSIDFVPSYYSQQQQQQNGTAMVYSNGIPSQSGASLMNSFAVLLIVWVCT